MNVIIDLGHNPAHLDLVEPDVFDRFAVVVTGPSDSVRFQAAVSRIGLAHGSDHVYVEPDAVKALAGERASDPQWLEQFDGMVDYARSKGWSDADGGIRAHLA